MKPGETERALAKLLGVPPHVIEDVVDILVDEACGEATETCEEENAWIRGGKRALGHLCVALKRHAREQIPTGPQVDDELAGVSTQACSGVQKDGENATLR